MKTKTVSSTPDALPKPNAKRLAQLERLAAASDDEIDTQDIPELTESRLAELQRKAFYRPVKKQITARLDADVLAWLRSGGKGYQSRMNAILRRAMLDGE